MTDSDIQPHHRSVLDRFVQLATADERIVAAVLSGSYARDAADSHSDLDLGLITTDAAFDDVLSSREAFARQLGDPLLLEDFDNPHVLFLMFADGAEVELAIGSQSHLETLHNGPFRVLVDKSQLLRDAVLGGAGPPKAQQVELLRRQVMWFWHDVSHFTTALARGHLWWAHGQLDLLRTICINLIRLQRDFAASADGYDKVDLVIAAERLAPLESTFCPLQRGAMLEAVHVLVGIYRDVASQLGPAHGIAYPHALDRIVSARLERLD